MEKPVEGQKVFVTELSDRTRKESVLYPGIIKKVGRKYFIVEYTRVSCPSEAQFLVATWKQKPTGYGYGESCRLYKSHQEFDEKKEVFQLHELVRSTFSRMNRPEFSLEQYRKVCEVLELKEEAN